MSLDDSIHSLRTWTDAVNAQQLILQFCNSRDGECGVKESVQITTMHVTEEDIEDRHASHKERLLISLAKSSGVYAVIRDSVTYDSVLARRLSYDLLLNYHMSEFDDPRKYVISGLRVGSVVVVLCWHQRPMTALSFEAKHVFRVMNHLFLPNCSVGSAVEIIAKAVPDVLPADLIPYRTLNSTTITALDVRWPMHDVMPLCYMRPLVMLTSKRKQLAMGMKQQQLFAVLEACFTGSTDSS